jgi:hypothetical protein
MQKLIYPRNKLLIVTMVKIQCDGFGSLSIIRVYSKIKSCVSRFGNHTQLYHFYDKNYNKTRPVWTGFKIAVRHKLLTHYKKAKVLYD